MLRTVMSSVMRRRRGLISAIWKLLPEGSDRHPHPLRQETCHATKPLTPRQRLRSIRPMSQPDRSLAGLGATPGAAAFRGSVALVRREGPREGSGADASLDYRPG